MMLLGMTALTGCYKVDANLTISEDGTLDGYYTVAIEEESAEQAYNALIAMDPSIDQPESPQPSTQKLIDGEFKASGFADNLPKKASAETYSKNGYRGQTINFNNTPIESFNKTSEDGFTITRDGDQYVADFGDNQDAVDMYRTFTLGTPQADLSVTFPGEVTETTGTISEDGRTVTWDIPSDEVINMTATASATPTAENVEPSEVPQTPAQADETPVNIAPTETGQKGNAALLVVGAALVFGAVAGGAFLCRRKTT